MEFSLSNTLLISPILFSSSKQYLYCKHGVKSHELLMGKAPKFADFFKLEVQNPPKAQLGKEVRLAEHAQYEADGIHLLLLLLLRCSS